MLSRVKHFFPESLKHPFELLLETDPVAVAGAGEFEKRVLPLVREADP
jgi:hypothetical protein